MNKNINNAVELTEKELACVCGGEDPDWYKALKEKMRQEVEDQIRRKEKQLGL